MKKVFLIRHAKSSWDEPFIGDFDRPLNGRGKSNAKMMGERLKERGVMPDVIYSSSAKRAKATAKLISEELGCEEKIVFKDKLYASSPKEILQTIYGTAQKLNTVFVVSHNPGLNELAYDLVNFNENIPTTGILEIWFESEKWDGISSSNAKLKSFDFPKNT